MIDTKAGASCRGVAQPGSATALGAVSRGFESHHPDTGSRHCLAARQPGSVTTHALAREVGALGAVSRGFESHHPDHLRFFPKSPVSASAEAALAMIDHGSGNST